MNKGQKFCVIYYDVLLYENFPTSLWPNCSIFPTCVPSNYQAYDWTNLVSIDFSWASTVSSGIMILGGSRGAKCPPTKLNELEIT